MLVLLFYTSLFLLEKFLASSGKFVTSAIITIIVLKTREIPLPGSGHADQLVLVTDFFVISTFQSANPHGIFQSLSNNEVPEPQFRGQLTGQSRKFKRTTIGTLLTKVKPYLPPYFTPVPPAT